ncbi:MAG: hypothetical protein WC322_02810 [Candidatus Paceibacterota bacterium]|jgi:Cu2+-containing amine oxidase
MNQINPATYRKRLSRGMNPSEALSLPVGKPHWEARVELDRGDTVLNILRDRLSAGKTIGQVANLLGVKYNTLFKRVKKLEREGLLGIENQEAA